MFSFFRIVIFIRPFISSLAFFYLDYIYYILLIAFFFLWLLLNGIPWKETKSIKYPLLLFCLSIILSVIFSKNKFNSLSEIYKYICALLLFLIAASLNYKDKIRIERTIILAGFIVSLLAVYQYFFGFKHILNYITKEKLSAYFSLVYVAEKRTFFPFVTPNTLAGFLIMVIPLVLTIDGKEKWFILAPISLTLLFTKSLGAFLSLFLGMALYLYLRKDLAKMKYVLLVIIAICLAFVFILRQTAINIHTLPAYSLARRLNYWQDTLKIIKAHPFFGTGIGNFYLRLSRYAHNSYLQICAEMGIFGLISFLWIVGSIFKSGFQNINISPYKKQIAGLLTASAIFLIHNLVDFTFFLPEVALIWWIISGVILSKKK